MISTMTYPKKHNSIWSQIPDHPYGTLIIGSSGSQNKIII